MRAISPAINSRALTSLYSISPFSPPPGVTAAYLLTPYVPELKTCYRDTPMPGRLFHPDYRTGFRFGAVTFAPGMTLAEIASALIGIIADAAAS